MPYAKRAHLPVCTKNPPIQFKAEPFHYAIPDRELLDDLQSVARRLNAATLFAQQYQKHGRFSATILRTRFGSWNAALQAAHLQPSAPRQVEDQSILSDLVKVAAKLDVRQLHRGDYVREGRYGTTTISRRFGSWTNALLAAGLSATPRARRNPSNQELFNNFENLWRSLGRQPRGRDVALPHSLFDLRLYKRRFGTFRKALAAFVSHQHNAGKTSAAASPPEPLIRHKTAREVRARLRYQVLSRDHFRCRLCGRSPATDPSVKLQVDHKQPWSAGGETVKDNLQTLCETCNAGKSNS